MRLVSDNASSVLISPVVALDTTLLVSDGSKFPVIPDGSADYAVLTIEDAQGRMEQVKLVQHLDVSDALIVERNYNAAPSGALDFNSGARVEIRTTASLIEMLYQRGVDDVIDGDSEIRYTFKRFLVSGETPASGDLFEGEVAINIPDRKVWIGAVGATAGNPLPPSLLVDFDEAAAVTITQSGHGFTTDSVGAPIYFDGTGWLLANANTEGALGTAVVRGVSSTSVFSLVQVGRIGGIAQAVNGGSPLTPGTFYSVSTTPGQITGVPPQAPPAYDNVIMQALAEDEAIVLPWRPGITRYVNEQNALQDADHLGLIIALG